MDNDYINGFIEKEHSGQWCGEIRVDGVDLSPITATPFKQDGKTFIWLKRKDIMEYDYQTSSYKTRKREPQWECYLEKTMSGSDVIYKGEFVFLRFRYSIKALWEVNMAGLNQNRLNLFVERLPMSEQTILNGVNERKKSKCRKY